MKCCDVKAGDFRSKITIERLTRTADEYGGAVESWVADPANGLWAKMEYLTGTERWEAQRIHPGNLLRITIRWRDNGAGLPYYDTSDRIRYRGREFAILSVHDVEFRQRYIQLDVMEGRAT